MPKIAPSILAADFSQLGKEIKKVERHADMIHIDIMDGHFVKNITFGPQMVAAIRKSTKLHLDIHLMISHPERYIAAFAKAGADSISFHAETTKDPGKIIQLIRSMNKKAGIAINPDTPVAGIRKLLGKVDMALVMSVHPGLGGQKFIMKALPKLRKLAQIRQKSKLKFAIEADGGIDSKTAKLAIEAGADILVAGTYIYKSKNYSKAIKSLRISED